MQVSWGGVIFSKKYFWPRKWNQHKGLPVFWHVKCTNVLGWPSCSMRACCVHNLCSGQICLIIYVTKSLTIMHITLLMAIMKDWHFQGTAISSGLKYSAEIRCLIVLLILRNIHTWEINESGLGWPSRLPQPIPEFSFPVYPKRSLVRLDVSRHRRTHLYWVVVNKDTRL